MMGRILSACAALGTALSVHAIIGAAVWPRPKPPTGDIDERVAVVIPARNEAATIETVLTDIERQRGVPKLTVVVVDDSSTDATPQLLDSATQRGAIRALDAGTLPTGWLGKNHACHVGATSIAGEADALVFVDADVRLEPDAIAAAVHYLRAHDLAGVSVFPRQDALSWPEKIVQPLLPWIVCTFLPIPLANRSLRPSLVAANGQFLVVDAAHYATSGGHSATPTAILDDIELFRTLRRALGATHVVNGARLASCRMYDGAASIAAGYGKSLWCAFGGPAGSASVSAMMGAAFVVPPITMWHRSRAGTLCAVATASAVVGRWAVARTTKTATTPSVLHVVSTLSFIGLTAHSWWLRANHRLAWKDRPLIR